MTRNWSKYCFAVNFLSFIYHTSFHGYGSKCNRIIIKRFIFLLVTVCYGYGLRLILYIFIFYNSY
nr:MAG TPA: hypothetical protein [Caudoviricetes sp.]